MKCEEVRDWLLEASSSELSKAPPAISDHVKTCGSCRQVQSETLALETAWREQRLPAPALPTPWQASPAPAVPPEVGRNRSAVGRWISLAFAFVLFVSGFWWISGPEIARASDDVVGQLLDLNLELGRLTDVDQRREALRQKPIQIDPAYAKQMTAEESTLVASLVRNAEWLAENADPIAEVERLGALADQWVASLQKATKRGDAKRADRLAKNYRRLAERGLGPHAERVFAAPALKFDGNGRLEKWILRDEERLAKLAELLESSPAATRREIRAVLASKRPLKKAKRTQIEKGKG